MITVRIDTPWVPSAIMKVFKKGAFSKTSEIKFGKVRRAVGKETRSFLVPKPPENIFYTPVGVTVKAL